VATRAALPQWQQDVLAEQVAGGGESVPALVEIIHVHHLGLQTRGELRGQGGFPRPGRPVHRDHRGGAAAWLGSASSSGDRGDGRLSGHAVPYRAANSARYWPASCLAAASCSWTRTGAVPPVASREARAPWTVSTSCTPTVSTGSMAAKASAGRSHSSIPRSSHTRTHAPASSCACRNGTPWRTSHSATSVASAKPWGASSAIRSVWNLNVATMPATAGRSSPSVSAASNT